MHNLTQAVSNDQKSHMDTHTHSTNEIKRRTKTKKSKRNLGWLFDHHHPSHVWIIHMYINIDLWLFIIKHECTKSKALQTVLKEDGHAEAIHFSLQMIQLQYKNVLKTIIHYKPKIFWDGGWPFKFPYNVIWTNFCYHRSKWTIQKLIIQNNHKTISSCDKGRIFFPWISNEGLAHNKTK